MTKVSMFEISLPLKISIYIIDDFFYFTFFYSLLTFFYSIIPFLTLSTLFLLLRKIIDGFPKDFISFYLFLQLLALYLYIGLVRKICLFITVLMVAFKVYNVEKTQSTIQM